MAKLSNPLKANTFREETAPVEETPAAEEPKPGKKRKPAKEPKPRKEKKEKAEKKPGKEWPARVTGLFFLLFSVYLFFAFASYLESWWMDFDFSNKVITDFSPGHILQSDLPENWMGKLGAVLAYLFISEWFGVASFLVAISFLAMGLRLFLRLKILPVWTTLKFSLLGLAWIPVFLSTVVPDSNILYGVYGFQVNYWLTQFLGFSGLILLLVFTGLTFLIIAFNIPFRWFKKKEKTDIPVGDGIPLTDTPAHDEPEPTTVEFPLNAMREDLTPEPETAKEEETVTEPALETQKNDVEFQIENLPPEEKKEEPEEGPVHLGLDTKYDPTLDLGSYRFPPLELLHDYGGDAINVQKDELEANKDRIVQTLNNYAIKIQKIKATIGPSVTLYEIVPEAGVRISKIKNLENDIALSLAALGIRIIAPIPGKGTIGIEVPNQNPEIVSIKSLLGSEKFRNTTFELPFVLGKTIANETYIADLAKMPHILMAGATGQGKSVGLNTIITSILYKKHPAMVKFVMVDPKKVELSLFSKIERHYLAKLPDSDEAIITDTKKVIRTLNSLNVEMDNRYDLLQDAQVRNIREYNEKFLNRKLNPENGHHFLPYIIVFVDEFADLIMTAGREIETPMTRLAQLARAIGIHLVIATQRPSVNIITGTIKANFPVRIAFKVASKIDSRTILDQSGADQLVGRGDMLLSVGSDLIRLQCAFVDTPEIERVTEFIGSQRGYPSAWALPEFNEEEGETTKEFDPNQKDEMFTEAARLVVQHQQGSTSLIQRRLKLGYNRAGRIIDQLEAAGIVGPFEGSKAREVRYRDLSSLEEHLKMIGEA
jgi:DNA segregation ATPase FtsK/SpoIIIE, S-DNA-T family